MVCPVKWKVNEKRKKIQPLKCSSLEEKSVGHYGGTTYHQNRELAAKGKRSIPAGLPRKSSFLSVV